MKNMRRLFAGIPDTVFITDPYGYLLERNRTDPFPALRRGEKLGAYLPDCFAAPEGELQTNGRSFRRQTTPIRQGGALVGYTVLLTEITEEVRVTEARREKTRALRQLLDRLTQSNAELERYALEVKELADYAEQLRIARVIHDDAGHAITELHAICQMCLTLKDSDPARAHALLETGLRICREAMTDGGARQYDSLAALLAAFARVRPFPVEITLEGDEPSFLADKYPLIEAICREAYHNTLDHSLADRLFIRMALREDEAVLHLEDNGCFRGPLESGFGLRMMKENVEASGGEITFEAEEGRGFGITVRWRKPT